MATIAAEEVFKQDVAEREYNSMSFNIKEDKVAEAKLRLREFVQDFISEFQANPDESELTYQINNQFFKLDKN